MRTEASELLWIDDELSAAVSRRHQPCHHQGTARAILRERRRVANMTHHIPNPIVKQACGSIAGDPQPQRGCVARRATLLIEKLTDDIGARATARNAQHACIIPHGYRRS